MTQELQEVTKKGTTTVGIKCSDGIILAADKRATLGGGIIIDGNVDKIYPLSDNLAVTIAGTVSDAILIVKLMKAELRLKTMRTGKIVSVKEAANLLGTIVYQNIRKFSIIPGITGFIMGGSDETGFHLYDIFPDGSVTEHHTYITDGSGFRSAFGVLDTEYKKDIKVNDALKLGIKAINAAMQRDTSTGNGLDVFTITQQGVKKIMTKRLNTYIDY